MFKIKIFTIGKSKEIWLQQASEEYHKRIKNSIQIEWVLCKNDDHLISTVEKEASWLCLDPAGCLMTSEEFSSFLFKHLELEGSRLHIVIGGAEGLPKRLTQKSLALVSLSPMTFTHQMTRLILLEQIYRALEIRKGSSYHK